MSSSSELVFVRASQPWLYSPLIVIVFLTACTTCLRGEAVGTTVSKSTQIRAFLSYVGSTGPRPGRAGRTQRPRDLRVLRLPLGDAWHGCGVGSGGLGVRQARFWGQDRLFPPIFTCGSVGLPGTRSVRPAAWGGLRVYRRALLDAGGLAARGHGKNHTRSARRCRVAYMIYIPVVPAVRCAYPATAPS